ncbi:adenylate/guanylate cyclase domain-containing protein [Rhodobacterales bacterium]|nr:adenylate/guanylate cyclase domain-containing protein [Rhodobacterales bacterium]
MQRVKRRLAAIMCADVAHYSALMERDEDGTLDRLKAYRTIMSSLTERHNGRIVNTWGDAVIIEFASVMEAVQCAVEIQNELSHRNSELSDADRMEFRIGINLGDIMVEGDDIYGDGVNVAARLQELATSGGIMLSQSVHEQVKSKLAIGFERMGLRTVKNVSEPVQTFAVRLGGRNDPQETFEEQRAGDAIAGNASAEGPLQEPSGDDDAGAVANGLEQARGWLRRQPRRVQSCAFMIMFFLLLNLLTGISSVWFMWPSLPFIAMLVWHLLTGEKEKKLTGHARPGD